MSGHLSKPAGHAQSRANKGVVNSNNTDFHAFTSRECKVAKRPAIVTDKLQMLLPGVLDQRQSNQMQLIHMQLHIASVPVTCLPEVHWQGSCGAAHMCIDLFMQHSKGMSSGDS